MLLNVGQGRIEPVYRRAKIADGDPALINLNCFDGWFYLLR